MDNQVLQAALQKFFVDGTVFVDGDGYHFRVKIISSEFNELSKIKRQQKVYQVLHDYITSGELHALTIETLTPDESRH
jgi:acid stress-induced BolA-like protein IbaG/YrbA